MRIIEFGDILLMAHLVVAGVRAITLINAIFPLYIDANETTLCPPYLNTDSICMCVMHIYQKLITAKLDSYCVCHFFFTWITS